MTHSNILRDLGDNQPLQFLQGSMMSMRYAEKTGPPILLLILYGKVFGSIIRETIPVHITEANKFKQERIPPTNPSIKPLQQPLTLQQKS